MKGKMEMYREQYAGAMDRILQTVRLCDEVLCNSDASGAGQDMAKRVLDAVYQVQRKYTPLTSKQTFMVERLLQRHFGIQGDRDLPKMRAFNENDLLSKPYLGKQSLENIRQYLEEHGVKWPLKDGD